MPSSTRADTADRIRRGDSRIARRWHSRQCTAPKPPSDEGGAPQGRRERKTTPQSCCRMTAPLARGAFWVRRTKAPLCKGRETRPLRCRTRCDSSRRGRVTRPLYAPSTSTAPSPPFKGGHRGVASFNTHCLHGRFVNRPYGVIRSANKRIKNRE